MDQVDKELRHILKNWAAKQTLPAGESKLLFKQLLISKNDPVKKIEAKRYSYSVTDLIIWIAVLLYSRESIPDRETASPGDMVSWSSFNIIERRMLRFVW